MSLDINTLRISGESSQDHYHRLNPHRTGDADRYLDVQENPCPKGSQRARLLPDGQLEYVPELGFHDCIVEVLKGTPERVIMQCSSVGCSAEEESINVHMFIEQPKEIWIDDVPASIWKNPYPTGEVWTLDISDDQVYAIIEWHDYSPNREELKFYRICGGKVTIKVI